MISHTRGSAAWWEAIKTGMGGPKWEVSDGHAVLNILVCPPRLGAKAKPGQPAVMDVRVNFTDGRAHYPEWLSATGWESLDGGTGFKVRAMAQQLREAMAQDYYGALESDV